MSEASNKITCPGCNADLRMQAKAAFSPEILTVAYKLEPGRKMAVEDFCQSLSALAKSLKLIAKELGTKAMVSLESVSVSDGEVSATVSVIEI